MEKDYKKFDYRLSTIMSDETKINIFNFFKRTEQEEVSNFITWLKKEQQEFLFSHKCFIFPRLLEFNHFEVANELLKSKTFNFDRNIANSCSLNISFSWKEDFFNYFLNEVRNNENSFDMIKDFWTNFFDFQFQRDNEIEINIPNLIYVFDKIPFYEDSVCDIKNGYLINSRSGFFRKEIHKLSIENAEKIISTLGELCGKYYLKHEKPFREEFENFNHAIEIFNKFKIKNELTDNLPYSINKKNIRV